MRAFDWVAFLNARGIEWVERGPNVARGHINIKCPFCGPKDPSHHLGLNIAGAGEWGCFRSRDHRGRSPIRLVAELARISFKDAAELVEAGRPAMEKGNDQLRSRLKALGEDQPAEQESSAALTWEPGIRPLFGEGINRITLAPYFSYLADRGFDQPEVIARRYGLRAGVHGNWARRLIFPFRIENELRGWTGRALGRASVRYQTHPPGEGGRGLVYLPGSLGRLDLPQEADPFYIWGRARIPQDPGRGEGGLVPRPGKGSPELGGSLLVLVEGPVDALKVAEAGRGLGIQAAALLGVAPSPERLALLSRILPLFRGSFLLLDREAQGAAMGLAPLLRPRPRLLVLPPAWKDPGEAPLAPLRAWLKKTRILCYPGD